MMKCPKCDTGAYLFCVPVDSETYLACCGCNSEWSGESLTQFLKGEVLRQWQIEVSIQSRWYSMYEPDRANLGKFYPRLKALAVAQSRETYGHPARWRSLLPDDKQVLETFSQWFPWISAAGLSEQLRECKDEQT